MHTPHRLLCSVLEAYAHKHFTVLCIFDPDSGNSEKSIQFRKTNQQGALKQNLKFQIFVLASIASKACLEKFKFL